MNFWLHVDTTPERKQPIFHVLLNSFTRANCLELLRQLGNILGTNATVVLIHHVDHKSACAKMCSNSPLPLSGIVPRYYQCSLVAFSFCSSVARSKISRLFVDSNGKRVNGADDRKHFRVACTSLTWIHVLIFQLFHSLTRSFSFQFTWNLMGKLWINEWMGAYRFELLCTMWIAFNTELQSNRIWGLLNIEILIMRAANKRKREREGNNAIRFSRKVNADTRRWQHWI